MGLVLLSGSALRAQDISGVWQGTLAIDSTAQRRVVLKVEKGAHDRLKATLYSIDEGPEPYPVTSITRDGSIVKFSIKSRELAYTGTLSRDGNSINGTLIQGGSLPLRFDRATNETAWPLDATHDSR